MTTMPVEKPKSLRALMLLVGSLGTILVLAVAMAIGATSGTGDSGMTTHGYIAMALGILFTLALGGGLMALVFFSARRGYDDAAASGDETDEPR